MRAFLVLGALFAATAAAAQPVQPVPTASTPVGALLASSPHRDISNVLITARLATATCMIPFYNPVNHPRPARAKIFARPYKLS